MSENIQNKQAQQESPLQKDILDSAQDSKTKDESALTNDNYKQLEDKPPRLSAIVRGANELSVGISIVVAILLGIGIGIGLVKLSGIKWLFWLGVFWGVAAAILNLYMQLLHVRHVWHWPLIHPQPGPSQSLSDVHPHGNSIVLLYWASTQLHLPLPPLPEPHINVSRLSFHEYSWQEPASQMQFPPPPYEHGML